MTLRRICTIAGRAYALTENCPDCDGPMWTSIETPTQYAGCTPTQCLQRIDPSAAAPNPPPATPDATGDSTIPSSDTTDSDDTGWHRV